MAQLPLVVFDVNETLLDLESVSPIFERVFGDRGAMRLWFADLILYSQALTLANVYVPFTDIGAAVMAMLAKTRRISVRDSDKRALTDTFATMPPHPDVPAALDKLRAAGFRLFTLTDNLLEIQTRQLSHGGIVDKFERRFSVDDVGSHKPSRKAYAYVESQLGTKPSEMLLVASHTWDTIGALGAGWHAALIKRPGNDLNDVAEQLIARYAVGVA
jgi:2-haloacid dehalogenase